MVKINLRKTGGTFKGFIGEYMFQIRHRKSYLIKDTNKGKFLKLNKNNLTYKQRDFLSKYWWSLDAIEFNKKQTRLYEVKTRACTYNHNWKPMATKKEVEIYEEAQKAGFDVKIALVLFHKDWEYEIKLKEFKENEISISKTNPFDPQSPNYDPSGLKKGTSSKGLPISKI